MSDKGRFRYALEPILLTRQWELDALMLELGDANAVLTRAREALDEADECVAIAHADWVTVMDVQAQFVDRFVMYSRYLDDLAGVRARALAQVEASTAARDALVDRSVASKRGVEAVEQHRDEMKARFVQARASGDFKIADDQWNTLHGRGQHAA